MPICLLTTLGSISCFTIEIIASKTSKEIAKLISPSVAEITAQGTKTVPEPNIGRASTKPIAIHRAIQQSKLHRYW